MKNKILLLTTLLILVLSSCNEPVKSKETLNVLHVSGDVFHKSIKNARNYTQEGNVISGVVPHHLVAGDLISGFFKSLKYTDYETVIILAPDHSGGTGQAISANLNWSINTGNVICDTDLLSKIAKIKGIDFVFDKNRLQDDHSASNLIPYVEHYIPKAKVIPILLTNRIDKKTALSFAEQLYNLTLNKKCLVMFSIDFSHYLMPENSKKYDKISKQAILNFDYTKISLMNFDNLDCPPALNIFLKYTQIAKGKISVLDNTNASIILNKANEPTTSYFVISGIT